MKKVILSIFILSFSNAASASSNYMCSRYVNGDWKGSTDVSANSKSEAEQKAYEVYKRLGKKVDNINCKISAL